MDEPWARIISRARLVLEVGYCASFDTIGPWPASSIPPGEDEQLFVCHVTECEPHAAVVVVSAVATLRLTRVIRCSRPTV